MSIAVDIVSAQASLYSGQADLVVATASKGQLGIQARHAPLLAILIPGPVRLVHHATDEEDIFYVSGGFLEVQPNIVTIIADTALRAIDVDEDAALRAEQQARQCLADKKAAFDYAKARVELMQAIAQRHVIQQLRKKSRR